MTVYGKTKKSLKDHSLAPKKRFGQNFLVHKTTAEAIVRAGDIKQDETIIEVGVGLGALTLPLAKQAKEVIGIEIDSGIIRFHQEEGDLPDNVRLIHKDILKTDFNSLVEECGSKLKIMANLPYSISNPFIFKLIENQNLMLSAVIMLQKEVAERLMATSNTKQYGIPTVLLRSCATVKKMMTLKPAEFHPKPKIDSVVVKIDFGETAQKRNLPEFNPKALQTIVRASFSQRRKTLLNNLSAAKIYSLPESDKQSIKKLTAKAIESTGISPKIRAETLELTDFIKLANTITHLNS